MTDDQRCPHPEVVPINADWGRCTACGDSTFPLSAFTAGEADPPERPAPAKKKRRKGTSPTARTLAELRKRGWTAQVVERRLPRTFTTVDLFGVIDLVAITPCTVAMGPSDSAILGIQATTGAHHADRRDKILAEPRARAWIGAGGRLELWSWSLRAAGKAKRWTLRVEEFTADSWPA